jgi:hypothetical protein
MMLALGAAAWLAPREAPRARGRRATAHDAGSAAERPAKPLREHAQGEGYDIAGQAAAGARGAPRPSFALAIAPVVLVIALNYVFSTWVLPRSTPPTWPSRATAPPALDAVRGIWAIIGALTPVHRLLIALHWRARRLRRRSTTAPAPRCCRCSTPPRRSATAR